MGLLWDENLAYCDWKYLIAIQWKSNRQACTPCDNIFLKQQRKKIPKCITRWIVKLKTI